MKCSDQGFRPQIQGGGGGEDLEESTAWMENCSFKETTEEIPILVSRWRRGMYFVPLNALIKG